VPGIQVLENISSKPSTTALVIAFKGNTSGRPVAMQMYANK